MKNVFVPLSVPSAKRSEYLKNWKLLTRGSHNLLLIAGDQKMEHLNDDFYGPGIASEDNNPEHLFQITKASKGGVLATHLGLIAQFAHKYKDLTYIIKMNGKTHLGPNEEKDSSALLWSLEDVLNFKKQSNLKIAALGYTIYLGGKNEASMLKEAAQLIYKAHQAGLLVVLWMYPRGKDIDEDDIHTIAGGAGVASALGADFAKVKFPYTSKNKKKNAQAFQEAVVAAGKTKLICVGGAKQEAKSLLEFLDLQLNISGSAGLAIGRNLHQRSLVEAERLSLALKAMILDKLSLEEAWKIYNKK